MYMCKSVQTLKNAAAHKDNKKNTKSRQNKAGRPKLNLNNFYSSMVKYNDRIKLRCVSEKKKHPDIFDCYSKKYYHILIIFNMNISDKSAIN